MAQGQPEFMLNWQSNSQTRTCWFLALQGTAYILKIRRLELPAIQAERKRSKCSTSWTRA